MDPSSAPPPRPCREDDFTTKESTKFRIARKPLHAARVDEKSINPQPGKSVQIAEDGPVTRQVEELDLEDKTPVPPPRPDLSLETDFPPRGPESQLFSSPRRADTGFSNASASTALSPASTDTPDSHSSVSSTSNIQSSKPSTSEYVQKAYREARYFAGSLITHPYESTKHYTILRHSHGLVFYQGTSTTLAISIFADAPLPRDHKIWLQNKGWTGKTGMRAKSFWGIKGNWLDVTPSMCVEAQQLKPADERAWQRDIGNFQKKAKVYSQKNHILRETAVIRIPAEAGDGYFQLVLCLGEKKKVLCPSPVFRVLSTSTSPSSLRGASLGTLPLELGAMVLTKYTRNTVGTTISPVTSVVQNRVQQYMPSWRVREAVTASYDVSGAANKVNTTIQDANVLYDQVRDDSFTTVGQVDIPVDNGPQAPYPIHFFARSEPAVDNFEQFNLPSIVLTELPYEVSHKLVGYYFGWARFVQKKGSAIAPVDAEDSWHLAVISAIPMDAAQLTRASITEVSKKNIKIRLIRDFEDELQDRSNLEVQVMGFIRSDEPSQRATLMKGLKAGDEAAVEAAMLGEVNDVSITQSILDHPAWTPQAATSVLQARSEKPKGLGRVISAYAETRMAAQRQIDRVPLQKLGVRMPLDPLKDRTTVTNGFYVQR